MNEIAIIQENNTSLDVTLRPTLEMARKNPMEMQRLALDCTRLLRAAEMRQTDLESQGFIRRLWGRFSGQRTQVQLQNTEAFAGVQRMSFRFLEKLHEENLLTLNAVATVKNQLAYAVSDIADLRQNTERAVTDIYSTIENGHQALAGQIDRLRDATKAAILSLATRMKDKLEAMEHRIERLETASAIHGWLLTFEEFGYDRYPEATRMLQIVSQYRLFKDEGWTADDARYLKSALRRGGLDPEQPMRVRDYIQQLARENYPDLYGQHIRDLLALPQVDADRVNQNVSLPALNALYLFSKEYAVNLRNIELLARRHEIDPREELATQIAEILDQCGIETNAATARHHFAMELLTGIEIAQVYGWASGYQCPDSDCDARRQGRKAEVPGICTQCGTAMVQVV